MDWSGELEVTSKKVGTKQMQSRRPIFDRLTFKQVFFKKQHKL